METVRLNFAKLETLYKFRLITKKQLMNMLGHDWVSTYRVLTGMSSDNNLLKHEKVIIEHYPTVYHYITSDIFGYGFDYFVCSREYIKQRIKELYTQDLTNNSEYTLDTNK